MAANKAVVRTESQKKSSDKYVKRTAIQLTVKCQIEKFEALMNSTKPGEGLESEGVSSDVAPRAVWKLVVYPNGEIEHDKGHISVFLWLTLPMAVNRETLDTTFHLYLVDGSDGGKIDVVERRTKNFGDRSLYPLYWQKGKVSHEQVREALQADGSLVVVADIDFLVPDDGGEEVICEASALQGDEDLQGWATKFSELHGDEASSNCTIEIGGVSIPAHKSILMAHSPIFRSMFTHPQAEEFQSSAIKITDFKEPELMRAVVRYCYQGRLDKATMDGDGALEIFKLADRYCIAGLKTQLEKHFADKRLSVENVVAMAVLADSYTAPKLMEACVKLIAQERKAVFESVDWKEMKKARPELAADLAVATCLKL